MRISTLAPGDYFPALTFTLDAATLGQYLAATEDDNALYWHDGAITLAPPLAVAALAFRSVAQDLALEPGSLHTAQELTFHRAVRVGEEITAQARVAARSLRRGFTALQIEMAALDRDAAAVLSGRMTLMVASSIEEAGGVEATMVAAPPLIRQMAEGDAGVAPRPYAPLSLTTIAAGTVLPRLVRSVTQERIARYASASGDYNPIHLDAAFAAATPFGGTVAHGMLSLADLSTVMTQAFGHAWCAEGSLKVKFRNPVPSGTTVTTQGTVERVEQDAHGVQYAICALSLTTAAGETAITGETRLPLVDAE